jgi:hypothetical protein
MKTSDNVFIGLLASLVVIILFMFGMAFLNCHEDKKEKIRCENSGGIYKEFYGSKSVCFSPSAILPM